MADWGDLIKQMKLDMKKDEVRCYRALRGNFDGTFLLRMAPNVKPQNFKFILFIFLKEQKDEKATIIDNSYSLGVSWRITKYGALNDDQFAFHIFTDHSTSKVFNMNRDRWNFLQGEVNTRQNKLTLIVNDSGPMTENITGVIKYPLTTELTLGGNKAGCFFIGEICYYGLWDL